MMLPEHMLKLHQHEHELKRRPERNELDDQELQLISQEITDSLNNGQPINSR